jgi:NADH-quinone oxidoreductase subunit L
MASWLILLTIGLPWLGGVCVWLAGDRRAEAQHKLASVFAALTGGLSLALLFHASASAVVRLDMGGSFGVFTFVADGLAVTLAAIAAVVGGLAVIYATDYMKGREQLGRFYSLVLLFIGAMAGLVLAGSLLLMFLFWEITALCSYALISFDNDDPKAVYGGIKALIVTQIGGIGLLGGALLLHAHLGSYQISDALAGFSALPAGAAGAIAFGFLAAAAAKSAQVPFHTWLPDAMEAPTPVTALIHAATMVNAGVYLLGRFAPAFAGVPGWSLAVVIVGALSACLAAVLALTAFDLKRALAYSTISQLGYMVYAVGAGSVLASQFHLLSHALFKALLFLCAGSVIHAVGTRDMRQMGGLGRSMPRVQGAFVIGGLALVGLPLTNGFLSKELILEVGLAHTPAWSFAVMLLTAGLTALYTARMFWMVFLGPSLGDQAAHDAPPAMLFSLGALSLGSLTSWLVLGPLGRLLDQTLPYHHLEAPTTLEGLVEVLGAPATWLALAVISLGIGLWATESSRRVLSQAGQALAGAAAAEMGFAWLNDALVASVAKLGSGLRVTQTGLLSWNVAAILAGLAVVLAVLALGA